MKAADIMSSPVITVTPDTLVREVAELLSKKRISAVPVVDSNHHLAGMVSEADLLHRHEIGTDRSPRDKRWWQRIFSIDSGSGDYVRSHAVRVRDIMSEVVIAADLDTPLAEIANLLEKHRIKRVPVTHAGRVRGIVSRADLVRAVAGARAGGDAATTPTDEKIKATLLAELGHQSWWRSDWSWVDVQHGIVTYRGAMPFDDGRAAARVAAEAVPGVREVRDLRVIFQGAEWSL